MNYCRLTCLLFTFPSVSAAAIQIDGTLDDGPSGYGPAVAVQAVPTGFGDASASNGLGGGGELNAAYAKVENGRLNVLITGNIENNFNKLSVFIDSRPGGENTLSSAPAYDFENISQNLAGMTFDKGFDADFHLYARWGSFTGNVFTVDLVDRNNGSSTIFGNGDSASSGTGTAIQSGTINPGDNGLGSTGVGETRNLTPFLSQSVPFGFNNTNTGGIGPLPPAATPLPAEMGAALSVTTGFEFSIALADLAGSGGQLHDAIDLHVAYGNPNHNFHSNQILGSLPLGTGNLGGNGNGSFTGNLSGIDFSEFAGDQYFSVPLPPSAALIPEPGVGLALLGGLALRRRRFR
ncbi:MAG: hypothetical protein AAGJ38_04035 [Planctomycetota bacterium]